MAQQTNFVQEGVDRVRETVSSIEGDLERVQKRVRRQLRTRSRALEKEVAKRRRSIERSTQRRVKRVRAEFEKNRYVKRAQGVIDDATKRFEQAVDGVFDVLNVASKRDLGRIDRKLNRINRKLSEMEKTGQRSKVAKAS